MSSEKKRIHAQIEAALERAARLAVTGDVVVRSGRYLLDQKLPEQPAGKPRHNSRKRRPAKTP